MDHGFDFSCGRLFSSHQVILLPSKPVRSNTSSSSTSSSVSMSADENAATSTTSSEEVASSADSESTHDSRVEEKSKAATTSAAVKVETFHHEFENFVAVLKSLPLWLLLLW